MITLSQCLLLRQSEEGIEVAHTISKCINYGLADRNVLDPDGPNNLQRLVDELNDFKAVTEMLVDQGIIPPDWEWTEKKDAKKAKVAKFLNYSRARGIVERKRTADIL